MRSRNRLIWAASACVFAGLSLTLGGLSDGVHHDDDLAHFLFARWSWTFPGYLAHVWGRPGYTVPTAIVAWIGDRETAWHLARGLSSIVTLAASLVAAGIGRRLGLRYWAWIVLLCYAQPLNLLLSYTTLTENFTALYLVAALSCLHRQRLVWASALFSLALVSRLETVILLPAWWLLVFQRARSGSISSRVVVASAVTSIWAPMVQNMAHFIWFGTLPAVAFLRPSGSTEYLATGPLAFLPPVLLATTPIVFLLALLGARRVARRGALDVVVLAGVFLATHWLIKWFGVFASGGFARFVVAVSPLVAIAAAAGLEFVVEAFQGPGRRMRWIVAATFGLLLLGGLAAKFEANAGRLALDAERLNAIVSPRVVSAIVGSIILSLIVWKREPWRVLARIGLIVLLVVSLGMWAIVVRPLPLRAEHEAARDVSRFIREYGEDRPVFAANPWIAWWSGHIENPRAHKGGRLLSSMPVGTIFVWDSIYSTSDFHQLSLEQYREDAAYRLMCRVPFRDNDSSFIVFEKVAETPIEEGGIPYPLPLTMGRGERLGSYYELE